MDVGREIRSLWIHYMKWPPDRREKLRVPLVESLNSGHKVMSVIFSATRLRPMTPQRWITFQVFVSYMYVLKKVFIHKIVELFPAEDPPFYRIPALCLQHAIQAPYCTIYVFNLETTNLEKGFRRLCKSMKRDIPLDPPTHVIPRTLNSSESYTQLQKIYLHHYYSVAFLMGSYMRNCLLIPREVLHISKRTYPATRS